MNTPARNPLLVLGDPYTGTLPFPTLDEIKTKLGIQPTDTTQDAAITSGMISTIRMIESYLGRGIAQSDESQSFEPVDTRTPKLLLYRFPVASVTAVMVDGAAITG